MSGSQDVGHRLYHLHDMVMLFSLGAEDVAQHKSLLESSMGLGDVHERGADEEDTEDYRE